MTLSCNVISVEFCMTNCICRLLFHGIEAQNLRSTSLLCTVVLCPRSDSQSQLPGSLERRTLRARTVRSET